MDGLMYLDDPLFKTVDNNLIAWAGILTPDELDEFLDEPGGCPDDQPHSAFMRDIGKWCDHDFIYAEALPEPASIRAVMAANGVTDEKLITEMESRAGPDNDAQAFIILWNARLIPTRSRTLDICDGTLRCLGSWEHPSPLTDT